MKPVNIYTLSRLQNPSALQKLERQMSKREYPLSIKEWEILGLRKVSDHLCAVDQTATKLDFYYSFQIPLLGKEFDLLRISNDCIVNIELKSQPIPKEQMVKQLLQNRYYLAFLGKTVRSYTYVSETDTLYRLTKSDNLAEAEWDTLWDALTQQVDCYDDDIENLFQEKQFLISPLTDSERFLNRDYILTSQQKDICKTILHKIEKENCLFQGFTGLPGTGKTLLLYDLAMRLTSKQRACVLHFGFFPEELQRLDERLKRIDFYPCGQQELPDISGYSYVLIDEGHHMHQDMLKKVKEICQEKEIPAIFSYDKEEVLAPQEKQNVVDISINTLPGYVEYRLTNRIRMNKELSMFIHSLVYPAKYARRREYPHVCVAYANDEQERNKLRMLFEERGFTYIQNVTDTTCKEYEKVVMMTGDGFYYDETGHLRCREEGEQRVRNLFQGCNRAREEIALIIDQNEAFLEAVLSILQGERQTSKRKRD